MIVSQSGIVNRKTGSGHSFWGWSLAGDDGRMQRGGGQSFGSALCGKGPGPAAPTPIGSVRPRRGFLDYRMSVGYLLHGLKLMGICEVMPSGTHYRDHTLSFWAFLSTTDCCKFSGDRRLLELSRSYNNQVYRSKPHEGRVADPGRIGTIQRVKYSIAGNLGRIHL
jgi:hypothetical protein